MTTTEEDAKRLERKKRKEESRRKKKKLIEESGGVRPRKAARTESETNHDDTKKRGDQRSSPWTGQNHQQQQSHHRFGKVMDSTPSRNQPRWATVSIAVPGSIVANCQTKELRTQLVGQIARAATIFHVDEIVVFDDKLAKEPTRSFSRQQQRDKKKNDSNKDGEGPTQDQDSSNLPPRQHFKFDPHAFFARVLQYCETPQYLRRHFFPMHPDLQFVGLLAPIDAPHHMRAEDCCKYREGVVLPSKTTTFKGGSLVNCGIPQRPVELVGDTTRLQPGIRCTVRLDPFSYNPKTTRTTGRRPPLKGQVVSPSAPREDDGTYWGYTTRTADSLKAALEECPFDAGRYDLTIGTSERGNTGLEEEDDSEASARFKLPTFQHAMIVFGGVAGIEECVDADESLRLSGSESHKLFDLWINVCKYQGSRTIRTEEAVLMTLARLSPKLRAAESKKEPSSAATAAMNPTLNSDGQHDTGHQRDAKKEAAQTNDEPDPKDLARFDDDNSMSEESSDEE